MSVCWRFRYDEHMHLHLEDIQDRMWAWSINVGRIGSTFLFLLTRSEWAVWARMFFSFMYYARVRWVGKRALNACSRARSHPWSTQSANESLLLRSGDVVVANEGIWRRAFGATAEGELSRVNEQGMLARDRIRPPHHLPATHSP